MLAVPRADRANGGSAGGARETGMIVGHVGIAMGARALRRDVPLAWLLAASIAPDAVNIAESMSRLCNPDGLYSHSLPAIAILTLVLSIAAFVHLRNGSAAVMVGFMVVLHLLVDYLTGEKLLWAHGPLIGFNLYRWPAFDFAFEAPVIAAGWWMLRRAGTDPRWITSWAALAILIAIQGEFNLSQSNSVWRGRRSCRVRRTVRPGAAHTITRGADSSGRAAMVRRLLPFTVDDAP
ncbi:MAG TPA: hypothetical protein VGQ30_05360 [Gemmatimonadaceae bacterium]|nr:hypothetical protein [Gemmatimonadaceae bacterium]